MVVVECLGRNHKKLEEIANYNYFILKEEISVPYMKLSRSGGEGYLCLNLKTNNEVVFFPSTQIIEIELVKIQYNLKESK